MPFLVRPGGDVDRGARRAWVFAKGARDFEAVHDAKRPIEPARMVLRFSVRADQQLGSGSARAAEHVADSVDRRFEACVGEAPGEPAARLDVLWRKRWPMHAAFVSAKLGQAAEVSKQSDAVDLRHRARSAWVDGEDELARDLTRSEAIQHGARFVERERLFKRDFQAPIHDPAHDRVDRLTPGSGRKVGVAEVEAGEGERLRDKPLPEIGKRPALGLAEAYDVTQLADGRETAVEDACAGRVQHLVDASAVGKARRDLDEILVLPVDDLRCAKAKRARLLAFRAYGSDDGRASAHGELGYEQAHAAANGVDENDVPRRGHADVVEQVPRGEPLDWKGGRDVE